MNEYIIPMHAVSVRRETLAVIIILFICRAVAPLIAPLVWVVKRSTEPGEMPMLCVGVTFVALVGAYAVAAVVGYAVATVVGGR